MAVLSTIVGVLLTVSVAQAGVNPDDHGEHYSELTADTADAWVQEKAPAWNAVVAKFKNNPDVAFGDVCLSKNQVRKIHGVDQGPGAGGWPTVRIFNKETGYGGKAYEKKTSQAMCDELGPKTDYMQELVEEYATLCGFDNPMGCTDKEREFMAKWAEKPLDEVKKQHGRLSKMAGGDMKPEAKKWVKQRINVFKQVAKSKHSEEL